VPDSLVMKLMEARLQQPDCGKGFILDGFPRTIPQAEALKRLLESLNINLDFVVNLEVPTDVILDRLTTRRTCANPDCQEIYNVKSNPPTADGKCRKCGTKVVQRDDETETAIMNRLDTYQKKTAPLIGFYQAEGNLKSFLSLSSRDTVAEIGKALSSLK
jgi:adenylate kinase